MYKLFFLYLVIGLMMSCSTKERAIDTTHLNVVVTKNDTCKRIDDYLTKLTTEKNFSGGLLIVKDGIKIYNKGYGWADKAKKIPFTPGTLASMGSITKAFTATAILKLVEMGKVSLNDPLSKFFPSVPADKAAITIHQLLTHSAGFHEFLKEDGGDYEKINTDDFLKRAFSEPLAFKPGEKAIYTNVGYSMLGIIIEQVSGVTYEQFLQANLFDPIGIKQLGYKLKNPTDTLAIGYQNGRVWGTHQQHFEQAGGGPYWNLKANGGLEASLNEMVLWINSFNDHTILTDGSIEKMFQAHIVEDGTNGNYSFGYGCNIAQSRRNTKMIDNGGSNGIYFARLVRLPEEGLVFYMVTNESSMPAMRVLPNVTQLYFNGKIEQDALAVESQFESPIAKQIYELLQKSTTVDLKLELTKSGIKVDNDMDLWEVGQALLREGSYSKALILYTYYTEAFPAIVVSWNDLGDVYLNLKNPDEAIKCYKQALKLRPENQRAKESLSKLKN